MREDDDREVPEAPAPDMPTTPLSDPIRERLFKSRTLIISGEVNQKLASSVTAQLLALSSDSDKDITIFINSQGGHVESGDTIHDMIRFVKPRVRMVGTGWVASAGALIFVAADKANRYCLPNTRFLLHEPSGGIGGKVTDMQIQAEQLRIMRERFYKLFAQATGQTPEKIAKDTARDFWLTTQQALDYGLLGKVITSASEIS